jgi:predicted acyltransferase
MVKKIASYILISIIIIVTVILAVWDIIDVQHILTKSLQSLFIIFVAAVIILFIFSVVIKDGNLGNKSTPKVNP